MTNGNLAYKKQVVTRKIRPERTENRKNRSKSELNSQKHIKNIYVKDEEEMVRRRVTFLRILYMGAIAFSATFMISKFVAVNDTASKIKSLNRELENIRAYTSQKIFEMERSVDLSEVEKIATTKLGMQRPESYQMIYVDVAQNDVAGVTADEVEGAGNSVKAFFSKVKQNIIELFSIQ